MSYSVIAIRYTSSVSLMLLFPVFAFPDVMLNFFNIGVTFAVYDVKIWKDYRDFVSLYILKQAFFCFPFF